MLLLFALLSQTAEKFPVENVPGVETVGANYWAVKRALVIAILKYRKCSAPTL